MSRAQVLFCSALLRPAVAKNRTSSPPYPLLELRKPGRVSASSMRLIADAVMTHISPAAHRCARRRGRRRLSSDQASY